MTMNPFEQNKQQLLHSLTSQVEQEVIDYIRQEMQHDAPDSVPTEEELFAFFQSQNEPTTLDAYQQMLATDKLLEYAEISLRTLCDLIRYQQLKELGIVHSAKEFIQLFHPNEQEDTPCRMRSSRLDWTQVRLPCMERGEQEPPSVLPASTRLLYHMGNIFRDNAPAMPTVDGIHIDRKRLAQMRQKRVALGHKPDDHELEQQQGYTMQFRRSCKGKR